MKLQYLLVFVVIFVAGSVRAGEVQYHGSFPKTIDCTLVNNFKSIVESNKKFVVYTEKKLSAAKTEQEVQKWQQSLGEAQQRLTQMIEFYQDEYIRSIALNFYFEGDAIYKMAYPKQESLDTLALPNYELVNLCQQFIIEKNDGTLTTQIPGACSLTVNMSVGYMCKHPYNQGSDQLSEKVLKKIAEDFFVNTTFQQ